MCFALKKYIENLHAGNITACARAFKIPQPTFSKYAAGERIPRKQEMLKIYVASKGAITPNDFYDLPLLESERSQLDFFKPASPSAYNFPDSTRHNQDENHCQGC